MKIIFFSDCHLEDHERDFEFPPGDILILAGDIFQVSDLRLENEYTIIGSRVRRFIKSAIKVYDRVLHIPGNHEQYDSNIAETQKIFDDFLKSENITRYTYASKGAEKIDDVTFIFATLWTDIKKGNHVVVRANIMSDYKYITINDTDGYERKLNPYDTISIHTEHKKFLEKQLSVSQGKVVVVTHHAPHMLSHIEESKSISDFYYCCTDMEDCILDNPQIVYWIHGHLHTRHEYKIENTKIISNCRGYKSERMSNTFTPQEIEV